VLLDGRNSSASCLQLGIEPRVEEYTGPLLPSQLISDLNFACRDLEPDERNVIAARLYSLMQEEEAQRRKRAAGQQYGKGHPKLNLNSDSAKSGRDLAKVNANSAAGQIHPGSS